MRKVNKRAAETLDILTEGLTGTGEPRVKKVNNNPVFMEVVIEYLNEEPIFSGKRYVVGHYYEQNGDRMCDPEMEFIKDDDGNYYPAYFRQDGGYPLMQESIITGVSDGKIRINRTQQKDHVIFANQWMENIKEQQQLTNKKG